ncbi:uncharacterized protein LOC121395238 [Xenopus laevis]|uniref:Uncharacterized protein LOC121395238 n=1 Tax=Xenopus laevis TaxID=8355 RepID=A0A8J1L6H8_XENLA|nr:uncharacterized protein LOC121395238 [Xenopus laevis]
MESSIKFTWTMDKNCISFLDVNIFRRGTKLETDLFRKTTDKNSILHFDSFHPHSLKCSLPYTQYSRVKRIVSDPHTYTKRIEEMTDRFKERGYPEDVLNKGLSLINNKSRAELLQPPSGNKTNENRIVFVSGFSTASKHVTKIIHKHWHLLTSCLSDIPAFQQPPLMAYKRARNLKDRLVRADIGPLKQQATRFLCNPKFGTFPCLNCTQCNSVTKGDVFYHPHSGKKYAIKNYYTCDSSYVVYLLKCHCGLLYIGETTQKVNDRISKHKSTIRKQLTALPVPAHFQEARHTVSQLRFQVIDSVEIPRRGGDRVLMLKKLEMRWIHRLDTIWPRGLNREYTPAIFI